MAKLVAHVYSDALFEAAIEENKLDQLFEELGQITDLFKENPSLFELFKTPKIKCRRKEKIFRRDF